MQMRRQPGRFIQALLGGPRFFAAWLACGLLVLCASRSLASDESAVLQIRARTRLVLREVEHRGQRGRFAVTVSAQLSDQVGSPLPDEASRDSERSFDGMRLLLSLESTEGLWLREQVSTDRHGFASHTFARLPAGAYRLSAHFSGDDLRDPVDATLDLQLDRWPSELGFSVESTHPAGTALTVSRLFLRSQGQPLPGPVTLSVFDRRNGQSLGPKRAHTIVRMDTQSTRADTSAEKNSVVNLFLSPPPSAGSVLLVRAEYAGDSETAPSQSEQDVLVVTQARITLEASASEVAQGGRLRLSGTVFVTSEAGPTPLAGELVDIEASQAAVLPEEPRSLDSAEPFARAASSRPPLRRLLGTAVSDEQGRFVLDIHRLPLRATATELVAKVVPARRYIRPGISNELHVSVLPPEPVSLLPFLLPLAVSALVVLIWRVQRGLRERIARWLQARRARKRAEQTVTKAGEAGDPSSGTRDQRVMAGAAGVALSARTSLSLRRTVDTTLDGTVFDATFGFCVAQAQVVVTPLLPDPATQQRATVCDGEGRFVISQLRAGRSVVRISAPGYQAQEFAATVPHRGELRAITVRLLPLRAKLLADWQRVAQVFYGDAALVQTRTPQDLLRDATAPRSSGTAARSLRIPVPAHALSSLQRLTELVEEGYYSGRVCNESMLHESQHLAAQIVPPEAALEPSAARSETAPRPLQ